MDENTANRIYDILVDECKAPERWRRDFVYHQTHGECFEYRFQGALGFGGKFWNTRGYRPDGTWGDMWHVNQYPEDENEQTLAMTLNANEALHDLRRELLI